jgi:ribonuclease-3
VTRARKHTDLEQVLGHRFKRPDLLQRALTHASVRSGRGARPDNERLEFLGDRVLGLVIAELLLEAMPDASEGELARRFNRLVKGETCAIVARRLGLGRYLVLSESEADSGGRDKSTILADAMEALLGAIFLDAGFEKARAAVRALWLEEIAELPEISADAKSALQEWAQGKGLELPKYVVVSRSGPDHAPHFLAEVHIAGRKPSRGEGASRRQAEQAAADAMLAREGVWRGRADE